MTARSASAFIVYSDSRMHTNTHAPMFTHREPPVDAEKCWLMSYEVMEASSNNNEADVLGERRNTHPAKKGHPSERLTLEQPYSFLSIRTSLEKSFILKHHILHESLC